MRSFWPIGLIMMIFTWIWCCNIVLGENLSVEQSRNKKVKHPQPTVNLSAVPQTVKFSERTTLTWHVTMADKVSIEPGIGEVGLNDSIVVTPYKKTTYTITATGPGGTATDSIEVDVDVTDMPQAGIYYEYDKVGRITRIMRIPATPSPGETD